jgi:hypothetical protein
MQALVLDRHMGAPPEHRPLTQAKLAYDREALYVIFRVEDRYVLAATKERHGNVCQDSCVEFFFTPGTDLSAGYFNIEVNVGGTMLFHHQKTPEGPGVPIAPEDCDAMTLAPSLPRIIDPEIAAPVTWTLEYRLPLDVLPRYCPVSRPAPGVIWRANLYKCADRTSHPHWLTWSEVHFPRPRFHVPEDFGELVFE